jgi:hypothetical protein
MAIPAMFADTLNREQVEQLRKALYVGLEDAAQINAEDVKLKNKRMAKYTKMSTTIDPDERVQGEGTSLKTQKTQNKPL